MTPGLSIESRDALRGTTGGLVESRLARLALHITLDDLVGAVELARWPQAPRERVLAALGRGTTLLATLRTASPQAIAIEIDGLPLALPRPSGAASFTPGETLRIALAGARPAAERGAAPAATAGPTAAIGGEAAELSETGHTLAALARLAPRSGTVASAAAALLSGVPSGADELATALRAGVARSGLFYESHLGNWVQGGYPLAEVRKEPQAIAGAALQASGGDAPLVTRPETWPDALAVAVSRQLDTLEHGSVQWQGTLWPGQSAQLAIREEQGRDAAGEDDSPGSGSERSWQAELKIELPELGTVRARLRLRGGAAQVQLEPSNPEAARDLDQARGELAEALAARGIEAHRITVDNEARR